MKFILLFTLQCLFAIVTFGAWQSTKVMDVIHTRSAMVTDALHVEFDLSTLQKSERSKDINRILVDIENGKSIYLDFKKMKYGQIADDFTWFGKVVGENGNAILSVRNGKLSGTIYTDKQRYSIVPFQNHYVVVQQDSSRELEFKNDDIVEKPLKVLSADGYNKTKFIKYDGKRAITRANTDIDVLVLYTASLKNKYGANTEAMLQNVFDLAYSSYIDSNTLVNLNLANMQQLPADSILNNDSNITILLNNLKVNGYVSYLRRRYNADMVVVAGAYSAQEYCGLASRPYDVDDTMTRAFATVMIKPASELGRICSDLTFAHELGHNFSCNHDRDNTDSDTTGRTMFTYAYGYDTANFATIMSYKKPEIAFFSNPSLSYNGVAIGVANREDNALAIRNTRAKIADNSEEIDESLETGDTISGLDITGVLEARSDRDGYSSVKLGGVTTFNGYAGFNQWTFFISLYNSDYELIDIFDGCDENGYNCQRTVTKNLVNGEYRLVIGKYGDGYSWQGDVTNYEIGITTNYVAPAEVPCSYNINPTSKDLVAKGSYNTTVNVTSTPANCSTGNWSATENLDWISFSSGSITSGSGNGSWEVKYNVNSSLNGLGRIGTLNIAGNTHTVSQKSVSGMLVKDYRTNSLWQDEEYTGDELTAYNAVSSEEGKVLFWENAKSYCKNLSYQGHSNWRLPTKQELESIVNRDNSPTIQSAFYNVNSGLFWTSTELLSDTSMANTIIFSTGNTINLSKTQSAFIRCIEKGSSSNPAVIMYLLN